jgi:hypothetical protein
MLEQHRYHKWEQNDISHYTLYSEQFIIQWSNCILLVTRPEVGVIDPVIAA